MYAYDRSALLAALDPDVRGRVASLEAHDSIASTNEHLLDASAPPPEGGLAVCVANHQTAGRGRGAKRWHSPPGAGLLLSISRSVSRPPDSSLALALGVAVAGALENFVAAGVGLKWPNDLVTNGRKLGGILVESAARRGEQTLVVAGLGVNIRVTDRQRRQVDEEGGLPPEGLEGLPKKAPLERNALAAAMIAAVAGVLDIHPEEGFAPWESGWRRRDWLLGRRVEARSGSEVHRGTACGVDSSGALLLGQPAGQRRILSAEIGPVR